MVMAAFWPLMLSPMVSMMVGSCEPSRIVASGPREKWIASLWVSLPAAHPSSAALSLAAVMASLKDQSPSVFDSSSSVLTVMTLAPLGCAKARLEDISTATRTVANKAADTSPLS
jgi:hypothetical protein